MQLIFLLIIPLIQVRLSCDVMVTGYEVWYHPVSQPYSTLVQFVSESHSSNSELSGDTTPPNSIMTMGQSGDLSLQHDTLVRNGDTVQYTLHGLRPYTEYSARVRMVALGSYSNTTLLMSPFNDKPLEFTTTESGKLPR